MEGLTYEVATPTLRGERNRSCGGVSQTAIICVRGGGFSAREVIYILIENYIPFGYKNRISRNYLTSVTGKSDRINRDEIKEALLLRGVLIVNIDNGYFRPDGSAEDKLKARAYVRREDKRKRSFIRSSIAMHRCLGPEESKDTGQMSLKDFGIG